MGKYSSSAPSWQDVQANLPKFKDARIRTRVLVTPYDRTRVLVDVEVYYTRHPWAVKVVARDGGFASATKAGSVESVALVAAMRLHSRLEAFQEADIARYAEWEMETPKTL